MYNIFFWHNLSPLIEKPLERGEIAHGALYLLSTISDLLKSGGKILSRTTGRPGWKVHSPSERSDKSFFSYGQTWKCQGQRNEDESASSEFEL